MCGVGAVRVNDDNNSHIERRDSRFSQSPHCAANCLQYAQMARPKSCANHAQQQITCNTSSSYHVQHVVYHVVRRNSSAIKLDKIEIAFILVLFYWLKPLTNEGGEETGVPGENPRRRAFRKCHILKPENSSPNRDSNPHSSIGGRLGKRSY